MKTFTRILLLCLFPVLATGCEKEVITRYEQTGYNEYKFINNSSKDVFVAYESFDDGIRRDGFMIAKVVVIPFIKCTLIHIVIRIVHSFYMAHSPSI